ncbi:DUF4375 domain-containing protein [Mariniflexile gromovii]|uniref:DUF4375 domain-containing protein n=1 Tax=Mariniflexile gromovii TaxID=362523 RepID=A0ABS4BQ39_9FLAO|nr:DUF4375 domain-containing protein [Mariniflexile gromovii]MBP0902702.1 DUF4375 domain-containing protein [Mariniflexile gromovii]
MRQFIILILSLSLFNSNSQEKFNLEDVLKTKRSDLIIMKISTYLSKKSKYGEKADRLNPSQKIFLLIDSLESEINNGGFNQFYFNSSGNFSHETVEALLQIGATKS